MRFRPLYSSMYPWKHTGNIGLTHCKLHDGCNQLYVAAIRSKIHLELNVQVGCYSFHFDCMLTKFPSGLPTSFHYHLPLLVITSKSWLHNDLSNVRVDPNQVDWQALHTTRHSLGQIHSAVIILPTATRPMHLLRPCQCTHWPDCPGPTSNIHS